MSAPQTLAAFAASYRYKPTWGHIGEALVAFPCSTVDSERGFWSLADYRVSSVAAGTIWLQKRDQPAPTREGRQ